MKELIEFSDFLEIKNKLEIKIGEVISVEDVPKSKKLLKLIVSFGDENRTVVTNIKPILDDLGISILNKKFPFITNLKPVTMMGIESTAMIMPGEIESGKLVTVNSDYLGVVLF